eukprot:756138-Hanusia_phi.AAC.3
MRQEGNETRPQCLLQVSLLALQRLCRRQQHRSQLSLARQAQAPQAISDLLASDEWLRARRTRHLLLMLERLPVSLVSFAPLLREVSQPRLHTGMSSTRADP